MKDNLSSPTLCSISTMMISGGRFNLNRIERGRTRWRSTSWCLLRCLQLTPSRRVPRRTVRMTRRLLVNQVSQVKTTHLRTSWRSLSGPWTRVWERSHQIHQLRWRSTSLDRVRRIMSRRSLSISPTVIQLTNLPVYCTRSWVRAASQVSIQTIMIPSSRSRLSYRVNHHPIT